MDTVWAGPIQNHFHVLELAGRDTDTGYLHGQVKNWAYIPGKTWVDGEDLLGLPHAFPFGFASDPTTLLPALVEWAISQFEDGHKFLGWQTLCAQEPRLTRLAPTALVELLRRLEASTNYEAVPHRGGFGLACSTI
jgi:hypothetical protein